MPIHPVAQATREVLTAIRQRKRVNEVLELVLSRASEVTRAAHGSVITIDYQHQRLINTATCGKNWTQEKQLRQLKVGQGITGHVAKTGQPYLCTDTSQDPIYFSLFDHVKSEIVVPILVDRKIWGVINLESLEVNHFTEIDLTNASLFAEHAAFAIKLQLDQNEKERLQRHLMQAEKLASLGETIAGIAHEINNPLTSIITHASLLNLRRGGEADEISTKAILHHAMRTEQVVKNLLAFSRKESAQREAIGVNELIKQAVNLKLYQLRVKNIKLDYEPSEVSWPVLVNAPQLQQVLLNLLNNAEQAIEKNDGSPGVIKIEVGRRGDDVYINIGDNGKGIPADIMPFIFDPFFTTKGLGEGSGLGLSIVHSLIENHGGRVSVKSVPRQTVFTIELPLTNEIPGPIDIPDEPLAPKRGMSAIERALAGIPSEPKSIASALKAAAAAPAPVESPAPAVEAAPAPEAKKPAPTFAPKFKPAFSPARPPGPPTSPVPETPAPAPAVAATPAPTETAAATPAGKLGRILVVDDEEGIVGAVCDYMEMMDIATHHAHDGLQGLALIKANKYDAIISDIRMPNMDGKQMFAEAVKLEPEYNKRFIFMSGDLIRDTTQAFVKTITCHFLAKPFALHQMHKLVVPLLNNFSETVTPKE